ncbi:MAG: protein translocase subunit SecF, partial [Oscillospiraceae bacterium]|nr:protein translocase subunit SecF [Oscillospiraceae bacterium]
VFISRRMIRSLAKYNLFRNPALYGGRKTNFNIDFNRNAKKYFAVSLVAVALIAVAVPLRGVLLDIQFTGGTMVTYAYDGQIDMNSVASAASGQINTDVTVRHATDIASNTETLVLSMPGTQSYSVDEMAQFTDALQAAFPQNNLRSVQINNIDPTIGGEFLRKCLAAVAAALAIMLVYVALRFKKIGGLSAGFMSIVALVHNCIVAFGVFVAFGFALNDNFMAVILTIVAYSLNDTIVLYDRIRENKRLLSYKTPVDELVNRSINQSIHRSINTSSTTALAMLVVTVMALIFNVQSIVTFAFPLTVGLLVGMYSSICLAGPLWVKWQQRKSKKA